MMVDLTCSRWCVSLTPPPGSPCDLGQRCPRRGAREERRLALLRARTRVRMARRCIGEAVATSRRGERAEALLGAVERLMEAAEWRDAARMITAEAAVSAGAP